MARTTKPLTNTQVSQAKPKHKVYALSDGDGLQLRVKTNGSRLWLFNYQRPYTKIRTCLSFGPFPEISLADARKLRDAARKLLAKDIDPQEHRDENHRQKLEEHSNTFEHIAAQWLEIKKSTITEDHAKDTWRSLELHVFPTLGAIPISKLTAIRTIEVLKPVEAKGNLDTIKRLCQRINEVMVYALNSGVISTNPLASIGKAFRAAKKQHLPTIKPEQLPELMRTIANASIKRTTRCLIEWQLHTMVRPSEAAGTRWDEIDLENRLWTIPPQRMKLKKQYKNDEHRAHIVPLSDQSIALLEVMRPFSGNREHVFPADRNPRSHANPSTANVAIKRMGYGGILVSHGMRSIASTLLNEQGFDPDVIEACLAHTGKNEVRNAYNRANYLERRKPVMQWWSNHLSAAASGNLSLAGSNVLPMIQTA